MYEILYSATHPNIGIYAIDAFTFLTFVTFVTFVPFAFVDLGLLFFSVTSAFPSSLASFFPFLTFTF